MPSKSVKKRIFLFLSSFYVRNHDQSNNGQNIPNSESGGKIFFVPTRSAKMGRIWAIVPRARPAERGLIQTARRRPILIVRNTIPTTTNQRSRSRGAEFKDWKKHTAVPHSLVVVRPHMGHGHSQRADPSDEQDQNQVIEHKLFCDSSKPYRCVC
jgi:hypothetical protein